VFIEQKYRKDLIHRWERLEDTDSTVPSLYKSQGTLSVQRRRET